MTRHLLDALAVRRRVVERTSQCVPRLGIDARLVEPEDLDEAGRDQTEFPFATATITERQRIHLARRIVAGDDVIAVVAPSAIDESALTGSLLDRRIAQHPVELDRLPVAQVDHRPSRIILIVIVPALDGDTVLERDIGTEDVEDV